MIYELSEQEKREAIKHANSLTREESLLETIGFLERNLENQIAYTRELESKYGFVPNYPPPHPMYNLNPFGLIEDKENKS